MKDIFGTIGRIMGLIFAAAVIFYTAYLTFQLSARIIPGDMVAQAMTLVLFDVGALVWFVLFITQARGTLQWSISGIGFLIGLAGAIIMAGAEIVLSQNLVAIADPTKIGWVVILANIIAALAHASLSYAFHLTEPELLNRIENSQQIAQAIEHGYRDARRQLALNVDELTSDLVASTIEDARYQIGLSTARHLRAAGKSPAVLEGVARDVGQVATPIDLAAAAHAASAADSMAAMDHQYPPEFWAALAQFMADRQAEAASAAPAPAPGPVVEIVEDAENFTKPG